MKFDTATKETARQKTSELFTVIRMICSANEIDGVNISPDGTKCTITNDFVSLTVDVDIIDWELSVTELDYPLPVIKKPRSEFLIHPKAKSKTCFVPAWPSGCDFGWREKGSILKPYLSVAELAEWCVSQFMAIEKNCEIGQIRSEWRPNERPCRS